MSNSVKAIPAILNGFHQRVDGTISFKVNCQELTNEEKLYVLGVQTKFVNFFVTEAETRAMKLEDMAEAVPDTDRFKSEPKVSKAKSKSKSQQLRDVLFRLHEAKGGNKEDFEAYREEIMDGLIGIYKKKIEEYK